MKKALLLMIIPAMLLTLNSCGKRKTNSSVSSSEATTETTTNSSIDEMAVKTNAEVEMLDGAHNLTETRKNIVLKKGNKTYYSKYVISDYDEANGYVSLTGNETGYNNFDLAQQQYTNKISTYYDGFYSYTLRDDNVYAKTSYEKANSFFSVGLNFAVATDLNYTESGSNHELSGIVEKANIASFYGKELAGVESISFKSVSDGEKIESIKLEFTMNGYDVTEETKYSYDAKSITLPTTVILIK